MEIRAIEPESPEQQLLRLLRGDRGKHGRKHRSNLSAERGGNTAKRHSDDASQNRIFHGADATLVANEPLDKIAHFYIPPKRWLASDRQVNETPRRPTYRTQQP